MSRRRAALPVLAAVLAAACSPRAPAPPPAVAALLRAAGAPGFHPLAAGASATVWAERPGDLEDLGARAAFFQGALARELGVAPDPAPLLLVAVTNAAQVARLHASIGPGRHPAAFTAGGLVVLTGDVLGPDSFESLAHELAHRALARLPALPLWMEEGLAQHLGARAADALLAIRGVPRLPPPAWIPAPAARPGPRLGEAFVSVYPPPGPSTAAFYAQSRAWAGLVDAGRGTNAWAAVIAALAAQPAGWREILEKRFHFSPELMQKLDDADLLRVPPR